jgi:hypothetical protein
MTIDDDLKKHQAFIDGINNYVNECLDNKVSIDKIEQSILNIVREQIKKRNAKN